MGNRRPDSGHCRVPSSTSTYGRGLGAELTDQQPQRERWGMQVIAWFSPPATRGASSSESPHHAHSPPSAGVAPPPGAAKGKTPESSLGTQTPRPPSIGARGRYKGEPATLPRSVWRGKGPHGIGRLQKCRPLHFGDHPRHEVWVELHWIDADLGGLRDGGFVRQRKDSGFSIPPGKGASDPPQPVPGGAGGSHGAPPPAHASSEDCE